MSTQFTRSQSFPETNQDESERNMTQEEGVVRDILNELDRERSRRAELEAQLRQVTEQSALDILTGKPSTLPSSPSATAVSRSDWIALQTERDGYRELLETITADNDAIVHASRAPSSSSLPLYLVRLLEIMPWHDQVKEHAFVTESIFEWQFHFKGEWTSAIRHFPVRFRTLRIVKPQQPEHSKRLFGGEQPPRQGVLTDALLTSLIDVTHGYPLPNDDYSTWEWVAGWTIDKSPNVQERKIDCDVHGWSYAHDPEHFLNVSTTHLCFDRPTGTRSSGGDNTKASSGVVTRPFRRRNWKRRRVLISYPHASQSAIEYLSLLRENARLGETVQKLGDQVADMRGKMTDAEYKVASWQQEAESEMEKLRQQVKKKEEIIAELELADELKQSTSKAPTTRVKSDGNLTAESTDGDEDSTSSAKFDNDDSDEDRRFDWKRLGRVGLMEQIKKSPAGSVLLQGRKDSL